VVCVVIGLGRLQMSQHFWKLQFMQHVVYLYLRKRIFFYAFLKPDFGCKSENKCKNPGLEADK